MLKKMTETAKNWQTIQSMIANIMQHKEMEERERQKADR